MVDTLEFESKLGADNIDQPQRTNTWRSRNRRARRHLALRPVRHQGGVRAHWEVSLDFLEHSAIHAGTSVSQAMLQREKISHAYEYSARVSRRELIQKLVESTVRRVAGPQPDALLSAFVDLAARADDDQLKRLEELIARRRAELDQP